MMLFRSSGVLPKFRLGFLAASASLLLSGQFGFAQIWTGAVDSNWNNPGNWFGSVPGPGDHVFIGETGNNKPVISQGAREEISSLLLETELTITGNSSLLLTGNLSRPSG